MIAAPKAFMIDAASILLEAAVQQLFLVTNDNRFQANPDGEGVIYWISRHFSWNRLVSLLCHAHTFPLVSTFMILFITFMSVFS